MSRSDLRRAHLKETISGIYAFMRRPTPSVFRLFRMNFIVSAINLGTSVMLARGLGPDARGQYAILAVWVGTTAYLALCGTHMLFSRRAAAYPKDFGNIYIEAMRTVAVLTPFAITLFFVIALSVSWIAPSEISVAAWIIASLSLPFSIWNAMQMQLEIGRLQTDGYIASLIASATTQAVIVLALWLNGRTSVTEYVFGLFAGSIVACWVCHKKIAPTLPKAGGRRLERGLIILARSRKDAVSVALLLAANTADRLVVSVAFPAKAVGIYIVAISVSQIQNMATEAMAPLFFGNAAAITENDSQSRHLLVKRLRQSVLINMVTALGLVTAGPILLPLAFGETYRPGIPLLYLLLPAFATKAAMRPFEEFLRGSGKANGQSAAHLIMLTVFFAGTMASLHVGSIMMTAVSLLAGTIVGFVFLLFFSAFQLNARVVDLVAPKLSDLHDLAGRLHKIKTQAS